MSNASKTFEKPTKRAKVDKISIEATLRNTSNSGTKFFQRDEEVDKRLSKGKSFKGKGKSKKVKIYNDEYSSEEKSIGQEFPKEYSSGDDSDENFIEDDFLLSKLFKKAKYYRKKLVKDNLLKEKKKSTSYFSFGESTEEESATSVASSHCIQDDALSKVLGPEHSDHVRGVGSGVTPSKLGAVSEINADVTQLREEVGTLMEEMARQNEIIVKNNELIKTLIAALQEQQGGSILNLTTTLPDVSALSENMMHTSRNTHVSKVQRVGSEHILEPPAASNPSQSSSPPQSRGNANMNGRKCKLMNLSVAEEVVAIGRWDTNEPNTMVHSARLGENACRVCVDDVINGFAPLWRINSFMETMADAKGTMIAWPKESIIFVDENQLIKRTYRGWRVAGASNDKMLPTVFGFYFCNRLNVLWVLHLWSSDSTFVID